MDVGSLVRLRCRLAINLFKPFPKHRSIRRSKELPNLFNANAHILSQLLACASRYGGVPNYAQIVGF
jgi:hypothetical protein